VERVQLEKNVFVKWVGFLVWGLDHLQLVSQKIPKHLETYQNIPKHTKKSQRKKRSEVWAKFFCSAFLAADFLFVFWVAFSWRSLNHLQAGTIFDKI